LSARRPLALLAVLLVLSSATLAPARARRPRFEPTDLELEDSGVAEIDVQAGPALGNGGTGRRLVVPDLELDIGVMPNVELDVDAALAIDHVEGGHPTLDSESIWTSVKLGLTDARPSKSGYAVATGIQLGPRLPTIGTRGMGYAGLALLGVSRDRMHLVGNLGVIVDPGPQITRGQAKSAVAGIGVDLDLDARDAWSLIGGLATALYWSDDPDELSASAGVAYNVLPSLEVSVTAVAGFLSGGDRGALLLGVSPKLSLW
jgi:hypothetical protein